MIFQETMSTVAHCIAFYEYVSFSFLQCALLLVIYVTLCEICWPNQFFESITSKFKQFFMWPYYSVMFIIRYLRMSFGDVFCFVCYGWLSRLPVLSCSINSHHLV